MDKHGLVRVLLASLEQEVGRAIETAERARGDAVHEEARPENDKDTRALESSYLARGQAQRVVDLQEARKRVAFMDVREFGPDDPIGLSALIQLESESGELRWYLLAAAGGGRTIQHDAISVYVITPQAPLGRALFGRQRGDELELALAARPRELITIRELR